MSLPKFLTRKSFDLCMFGYIRGVKKNMPTVSVSKIVEQFMNDFNLDPDDFNTDSARVTYEQMNNEFMQMLKNEKRKV